MPAHIIFCGTNHMLIYNFYLSITHRVSAKHAETIKSPSLRTSTRSFTPPLSAFDQPPPLSVESFMDGPFTIPVKTWNQLILTTQETFRVPLTANFDAFMFSSNRKPSTHPDPSTFLINLERNDRHHQSVQ